MFAGVAGLGASGVEQGPDHKAALHRLRHSVTLALLDDKRLGPLENYSGWVAGGGPRDG